MAEAISIIAVLGSSKSGKSTASQCLVEHHGYVRVRFAQTLKDMLMVLGLTAEQVDGPQSVREQPLDLLCGKSPRYAMQTLGTEWRDTIDKRLWARIARKRVSDMIERGQTKIVIDDMRFLHEAEMFRELGCLIVAIRRPEVEPRKRERVCAAIPMTKFMRRLLHLATGIRPFHRSETEWFRITPDVTISNTGTLDDLYLSIERAVL